MGFIWDQELNDEVERLSDEQKSLIIAKRT